jgi:hypothetical protein
MHPHPPCSNVCEQPAACSVTSEETLDGFVRGGHAGGDLGRGLAGIALWTVEWTQSHYSYQQTRSN